MSQNWNNLIPFRRKKKLIFALQLNKSPEEEDLKRALWAFQAKLYQTSNYQSKFQKDKLQIANNRAIEMGNCK